MQSLMSTSGLIEPVRTNVAEQLSGWETIGKGLGGMKGWVG